MKFVSITPNEFEGMEFDFKIDAETMELLRLQKKYENVNLENITINDCETMRELCYVINEVNK